MFFYLLYVIWLEMDGKELYKSSTKRPSLIQLQTKRSHHPCIPFRWNVFDMTAKTCEFTTWKFYIEVECLQSLFVFLLPSTNTRTTSTKTRWFSFHLWFLRKLQNWIVYNHSVEDWKWTTSIPSNSPGENPTYPRTLKSATYVLCAGFGAGWNQIWGRQSPIWDELFLA